MILLILLAGLYMIHLVHGDDSSTTPESSITTSTNSTEYTVFAPTNTPTFNLDAQVTFKWQENGGNGWGGVYCDTPGFNDNVYFPNSSAKTTTGTTTWSLSGSALPINNNKNWPLTCSFVMWWDTGKSARPLGYPSSTGGGTFVLEDMITITSAQETTPTSWVIQTATVFPSKTPEPTPSSGSTFIPEPTTSPVTGNGLSKGGKAGIAVGAVAGSALVAGVIYWIIAMQRKLAVQNERLSWIEDVNSVAPGKPEFSVGSPTRETTASIIEKHDTEQHEMNVPDVIVEMSEMNSQQRNGDGPHELPEKWSMKEVVFLDSELFIIKMSLVHISSKEQFSSLLTSSTIVVTDFYADWCGPCKAIAPMYEQLANQLSRKNQITFTKVNVDQQQDIAKAYGVTAMPTFIMFKRGRVVTTIRGADPNKLSEAIRKLATEANNMESSGAGESSDAAAGSSGLWTGASLPRNYADVTEAVTIKDLDMANRDSEKGAARVIFDKSKPSALDNNKGKGKEPDWVESDTDEQLMLYIPFNSTLKVHSLHITSLPPKESEDDDDDELPMRPKTLRLYTNRATILGFEEAEDIDPVQTVTIAPEDWDSKTGTAKVELRFVKFQKVNSMVVFFVDGDGDGEKIRIDRIRVIGEAGQAREMGKLEKIGDEAGE